MNPRKPTALKLLSGNAGKRALNAAEPQFDGVDMAAPAWLMGEGLAQWRSLAGALDANGMLNTANREVLATYCDLLGRYIEKRLAGEDPDLKISQQIRMMAREFGFTPSSQSGIAAPGKAREEDKKARFFG